MKDVGMKPWNLKPGEFGLSAPSPFVGGGGGAEWCKGRGRGERERMVFFFQLFYIFIFLKNIYESQNINLQKKKIEATKDISLWKVL